MKDALAILSVLVGIVLLLVVLSRNSSNKPAGPAPAPTPQRYAITWIAGALPELMINTFVVNAARETGVAAEKIKAVLFIESRGNPRAVNPADPSYGLMQLLIPTASFYAGRTVTSQELLDNPALNVSLGAKFLATLQGRYAARFSFAVWAQAYNVGETKFDAGIRNPGYGAFVFDSQTGVNVRLNPEQLADVFRQRGV